MISFVDVFSVPMNPYHAGRFCRNCPWYAAMRLKSRMLQNCAESASRWGYMMIFWTITMAVDAERSAQKTIPQ